MTCDHVPTEVGCWRNKLSRKSRCIKSRESVTGPALLGTENSATLQPARISIASSDELVPRSTPRERQERFPWAAACRA